jgi:hypothetical protein
MVYLDPSGWGVVIPARWEHHGTCLRREAGGIRDAGRDHVSDSVVHLGGRHLVDSI